MLKLVGDITNTIVVNNNRALVILCKIVLLLGTVIKKI